MWISGHLLNWIQGFRGLYLICLLYIFHSFVFWCSYRLSIYKLEFAFLPVFMRNDLQKSNSWNIAMEFVYTFSPLVYIFMTHVLMLPIKFLILSTYKRTITLLHWHYLILIKN
jgi:hypothetical protein